MKYEKLFQPGKIGNLELRNRVVMTAMGALMGDWNGCTTPEQIRFYEDRAKGRLRPHHSGIHLRGRRQRPLQPHPARHL